MRINKEIEKELKYIDLKDKRLNQRAKIICSSFFK